MDDIAYAALAVLEEMARRKRAETELALLRKELETLKATITPGVAIP